MRKKKPRTLLAHRLGSEMHNVAVKQSKIERDEFLKYQHVRTIQDAVQIEETHAEVR